MATRAMDPTLARQAVLIAGLLCAVPSAAVGVFALRDAPEIEHRSGIGLGQANKASTLDEAALGIPWRSSQAGRHERAVDAPGDLDARASRGPGMNASVGEAGDSVAADPSEEARRAVYDERKRRFEEELAAGQSRPDLEAALQARFAAQSSRFGLGDARREIRCTNSVCEMVVGAILPFGGASASMADLAIDAASEPPREGASGLLPWRRPAVRLLIDATTLTPSDGAVTPLAAGAGSEVAPMFQEDSLLPNPPEAPASEVQAADAPLAQAPEPAAVVDQEPVVDPAPAETPVDEPTRAE